MLERTTCFYVHVLKALLYLDVLAMSDLVVGHVFLSTRRWTSIGDQQNTISISILNMYVCIQFELHHILIISSNIQAWRCKLPCDAMARSLFLRPAHEWRVGGNAQPFSHGNFRQTDGRWSGKSIQSTTSLSKLGDRLKATNMDSRGWC